MARLIVCLLLVYTVSGYRFLQRKDVKDVDRPYGSQGKDVPSLYAKEDSSSGVLPTCTCNGKTGFMVISYTDPWIVSPPESQPCQGNFKKCGDMAVPSIKADVYTCCVQQ